MPFCFLFVWWVGIATVIVSWEYQKGIPDTFSIALIFIIKFAGFIYFFSLIPALFLLLDFHKKQK
ncbi:hypothetical protein C9I92_00035 [Photobacterium ganghwense]|uniref:Uncharacterized protein n=1 Tax=Photobacterium ganghwense TaxID=320778 RepID=A0A0J1H5B8_9GAMM|nr:hypothetical protein ABT57_18380 [Photobacterium ganghwense]PSU10568.1 hypothetical protein C9I92_00035 [Photobacterium ganghwense]